MTELKIKNFTGLCDEEGDEILEGAKVEFITGDVGEIVFECGSYGVAFRHEIDYDEIQRIMNDLNSCCGNDFSGCFNDNFLTLFEIYWNFNCDETHLYPIKIIDNKTCVSEVQ